MQLDRSRGANSLFRWKEANQRSMKPKRMVFLQSPLILAELSDVLRLHLGQSSSLLPAPVLPSKNMCNPARASLPLLKLPVDVAVVDDASSDPRRLNYKHTHVLNLAELSAAEVSTVMPSDQQLQTY